MTRRPDRWWMRWYAVRLHYNGDPYPDERVEFGALTRVGAQRAIEYDLGSAIGELRVVRRSTWLKEHP